MKITLKLYAMLADYLPAGAEDHSTQLDVPADITPHQLIDRQKVPRELAHLILRNGVYVTPAERDTAAFQDGDVVAIWPPVAGG
jgi:molybdopterin synthase sulfur carrier subunit